jgi:hypothetical protein
MTDIGFGLIDRRTVIVVLFVMVLANALFGLQLPIDTSTVGSLFIGLVLLTGYTYFARSIYRLPVAFVGSIMITIDAIRSPSREDKKGEETTEKGTTPKNRREGIVKTLVFPLRIIVILVVGVPLGLLWLMWLISSFGMWIEEEDPFEKVVYERQQQHFDKKGSHEGFRLYDYYQRVKAVFGVLDRIGVLLLAFLATVPAFRPYVSILGIIGLILMVAVFTFRGDFTGLVRDILEKEEKEKREKALPVEVKNSSFSPLYVKIVEERRYD